MIRHLFPAALAATVMIASTPALAAAPVEGRWITQDKDAVVQVKQCGSSICGRIVKFLKTPPTPNPKDNKNPKASLRDRPIMGLAVLSGFRPDDDDGQYKGTIYDPKSGKSYKSFLSVNNNGTLKVQGCVAFFCKTQTWQPAS